MLESYCSQEANYREEEKEKQMQQAMVEVQTLSSKLTEEIT